MLRIFDISGAGICSSPLPSSILNWKNFCTHHHPLKQCLAVNYHPVADFAADFVVVAVAVASRLPAAGVEFVHRHY